MKPYLIPLVMVALVMPATVNADALGRLFITPVERSKLDKLRNEDQFQTPSAGDAVPVVSDSQLRAEKKSVRLNGIVHRSDGTQVVWVNGEQAAHQRGKQEIWVSRKGDGDSRIALGIEGYERPLNLKPGQVWDPNTGKIREEYEANGSATKR